MKNVDNTFPTQNILSYCTGIRGIERGLERSGLPVKTIAFLEIEAFIVANLVAQMEVGLLDPAPIWTNIKTFDARPFRGLVHGIVGGYPCQPFSHAGERKGIEDERHLFPYILQQIEIIRPQWVYFENVSGHLSMGYEEVRRSLSDLGYRVEEGIFTAQEVGAPHKRERLFILGVMENSGIIGWGRRCAANKGWSQCETETQRSASTMGYAAGIDQQYDRSGGQAQNIQNRRSGDFMDNPGGYGPESDNTIQTGRNSAELTSQGFSGVGEVEGVDNAFNSGLQGHAGNDSGERGWPQQERSATEASLFPAGQGAFQYDWEEPRTIESSVEYTAHGYSFTEDLHRAIGNSVVEQTAELAFLTLLKKHIKNSQL